MTTDAERREATDQWIIQTREQQLRDIRAQLAAVTAERDAAVSALRLAGNSEPGKGTGVWVPLDKWTEIQTQLANGYDQRRTAELTIQLEQLRVELAGVLETALIRGESLGYVEIDDDYRARLRELDPDAEILQDDE